MRVFLLRFRNKRAQSGAEYMVLLGMVVAATLVAFNTLLPKIVREGSPQACASGDCGYATRLFANIVTKINAN